VQAVNLLPEYARAGRKWTAVGSELNARKILQLGGGAAIVGALLMSGLYFKERSTVTDKKSQLNTAQAHLVAQEARAKPIQDAQAANAAKLAAFRAVTGTRVHWDSTMGDLARTIPTGVHLSSMSAGSGAAGSTFTIAGQANSHDRVALLLDRLAVLPWLSGITLGSSSRAGNSVSFTITAGYNGSAQ
jgi:Tfp pilus assembly protein PilN